MASVLALAGCSSSSDSKQDATKSQDPTTETEAAELPEAVTDAAEAVTDAATPAADATATVDPATPSGTPGTPAKPAATAKPGTVAKPTTGSASAPAPATSSAPKTGTAAAPSTPGAPAPSATPSTPGTPSTPTAAAPGGNTASDVGVTADSIKLGGIFMYGYALGNLAIQPMHREMQAIIKSVNESGGIHGRRINYVDCDDGAPDPARTRACYKKLIEQEKIFAGFGGATFNEAQYQKDLEVDKVPWAAPVSLYREVWQNRYSFPIHMDMQQESFGNASWAIEKFKPKTFGVICLNTPEMLDACKVAEGVFAKANVENVFKRVYSPGTPDMSGDIVAARAADPDLILHYTLDPTVTARFFIDAQQQNYWPPMGISGNHMALEIVGGLIGDYPAKAPGGWYTNTTFKLWGGDYIAFQRKFAPNNKGLAHHVTQGQWFGANVMIEAMKQVGPNLTREGVMKALESKVWETGPGLDQRFVWDPAQRYAAGSGNTREFMFKYVSTSTTAEEDGTGNSKGFVLEDVLEYAPAVNPRTGTGG